MWKGERWGKYLTTMESALLDNSKVPVTWSAQVACASYRRGTSMEVLTMSLSHTHTPSSHIQMAPSENSFSLLTF